MCIFVYRAAVVFPSASARPDLQKRIHSARLLKHYHQSYSAFRVRRPRRGSDRPQAQTARPAEAKAHRPCPGHAEAVLDVETTTS